MIPSTLDRSPDSKRADRRTIEPLALSITEAAEAIGVSERQMHRYLGVGAIRSVKVGGRRLVPVAELSHFLDGTLPPETNRDHKDE